MPNHPDPTGHPTIVSAPKEIGEPVVNRQNETVGTIVDVVVDIQDGSIRYAVLSFGGVMGVGNKLYAVPWRSLDFSPTENKLILKVDKEKLKNAPGFDKDRWPDFGDDGWSRGVRTYYGDTTPV